MNTNRTQRSEKPEEYKSANPDCPRDAFQLKLTYKGHLPAIKAQIIDISLNSSGIQDTARVLKTSPTTVINELKKN